MNSRKSYIVNILATGGISVIIISVLLFWGRFGYMHTLMQIVKTPWVNIEPSGFVDDIELVDAPISPKTSYRSLDGRIRQGNKIKIRILLNCPVSG